MKMRDKTDYLFRVGNLIFRATFGIVLMLAVNTTTVWIVRAQETAKQSQPELAAGATANKGDDEALRKNVQQLTDEVQRLKKTLVEVQRDRLLSQEQNRLQDSLVRTDLEIAQLRLQLTEALAQNEF